VRVKDFVVPIHMPYLLDKTDNSVIHNLCCGCYHSCDPGLLETREKCKECQLIPSNNNALFRKPVKTVEQIRAEVEPILRARKQHVNLEYKIVVRPCRTQDECRQAQNDGFTFAFSVNNTELGIVHTYYKPLALHKIVNNDLVAEESVESKTEIEIEDEDDSVEDYCLICESYGYECEEGCELYPYTDEDEEDTDCYTEEDCLNCDFEDTCDFNPNNTKNKSETADEE